MFSIRNLRYSLIYFFFYRPAINLDFIDHVVGNQPDLEMESAAEWYCFCFYLPVTKVCYLIMQEMSS